jgi:hypothetical protein
VRAHFRRSRKGGISVAFGQRETALLHSMVTDLETLVGSVEADGEGEESGAAGGGDPLAAALGIGTSTSAPADPALARLFPDGYTDDDEGSADFRRYTQLGLRDARQARIAVVLDTLSAGTRAAGTGSTGTRSGTDRRVLDTAQAEAWLGVLTDLRLVLGERLEVTEDLDELMAGLAEDDPRRSALMVYDWLGWLQETLVQALS